MHYEMMARRASLREAEGLGEHDGVAGYVHVIQRDSGVAQQVLPLRAFDGENADTEEIG